jgi:hypothetical protein
LVFAPGVTVVGVKVLYQLGAHTFELEGQRGIEFRHSHDGGPMVSCAILASPMACGVLDVFVVLFDPDVHGYQWQHAVENGRNESGRRKFTGGELSSAI